jgi:serine protease
MLRASQSFSTLFWHDAMFQTTVSSLKKSAPDRIKFSDRSIELSKPLSPFSFKHKNRSLNLRSKAISQTKPWGMTKGSTLSGRVRSSLFANRPLSPASASASGTLRMVSGTLGADTFRLDARSEYNVFSGNGNVYFGRGAVDWIDLSTVSSQSVQFNLVSGKGSGTIYDPGNGARAFDAMTLSNGRKILFEGMDSIQFADGWVNLSVIPNDPGFAGQWNLHMMGVHNAWRLTKGTNQVLIGVQDTGVGVNTSGQMHPDLDPTNMLAFAANYRDELFRSVPGETATIRTSSHGTSVQGITSATSNNGVGISGINWKSSVFHIDVLDGNPGDQSIAEATQNMINYANQQGQRLVINMSLSGGGYDPDLEQLIAQNQNNTLFVIATGNDGNNQISQPSALAYQYSNVIAVGASGGAEDVNGNRQVPGTRAYYSNYGYGITLMGPTEVPTPDVSPYGSFDYNDKFNGTSAATPNVAGVASLMWSANPALSATQLKTILAQTAYDLGDRGYDLVYGHGFVNADAAVRRAIALA